MAFQQKTFFYQRSEQEMSDQHQAAPPPFAPPSALPDIVKKTPSFVPPRPPVLHSETTPSMAPTSTAAPPMANPFAPKTFAPPSEPRVAPTAPPVPAPPAPKVVRPPPPTTLPESVKPVKPEQPKEEVPLSPPPVTVSPVTSPAVLPTDPSETKESKTPSKSEAEKKESAAEKKEPVAEGRVDMTGGLMGWLTKTMAESKILNDVAEKAKMGMEQVLTTLDPGMRGFLSDDGTVELHMVALDSATVGVVKEGFERVFASVLVRTVPAATGSLPPLVSGSAYSLEVCRERSKRVFASKLVPINSPLLVMQPFLMEIDNKTFAATRLLLEWKGHYLDAISQLLPVDENVLKHLEARSKTDGMSPRDFSLSVSQAARELSIDCDSWAGPCPPYSFSELLQHASSSVALQFMNLTLKEPSTAPQ